MRDVVQLEPAVRRGLRNAPAVLLRGEHAGGAVHALAEVRHDGLAVRAEPARSISGITLLSAEVVWFTSSRAVADPTGLADSTPQGPGLERYVDPVGGFFFDYPAGLKLFVTDNGEDRVIFGDTPEGETRFMITAYPYVLAEPLTEEIIQAQPFAADFISLVERLALPSGATAFLSARNDAVLGATRDAHFVHGETAFHVSAVADREDLFNRVLQSWRFAHPTTP